MILLIILDAVVQPLARIRWGEWMVKSLEAVLSGIQVPAMFGSNMFSGKSLYVTWHECWIRSCTQHCCCLGAKSCLTLCDPMNCSTPGSSLHRISQKESWSSCHFLLQGIFSIQESNLHLLHCGRILLMLNHQGSPCSAYLFEISEKE